MDFKYLYEIDINKIYRYFLDFIDEQRGITLQEEKERTKNQKIYDKIKERYNPNSLIIENNVLPKIRELFMSNLQFSFSNLTYEESIIIKNKLTIMFSKFEEVDFDLNNFDVFDYDFLEIEKLMRKEVMFTMIDLKNFVNKINTNRENKHLENFLKESCFYNIDMVKCLTKEALASLINELFNKANNDIPGFLAMLFYLGFDEILYKKYNNKTKAYKILAEVLKREFGTIKGHLSSFNPKVKASKYTAYKKLDEVKDLYAELKNEG